MPPHGSSWSRLSARRARADERRSRGTSMQIKRLKLSGFKSFVEPAELRIEPGLTGVVGPNGCGKSNLLEAIRWAMGESSPKSLRGGGMDDVIFAGTASRPARDFAEVSMLIELRAATKRRAVKARSRGESSAARGRHIESTAAMFAPRTSALLFADAATGAHSPALVSQGKIGAVIAAKPVERRQLLEEAAGISGLARAPQGCRAEAARDRSQSHAPRRNPRRPGAARCPASAAGARGGTLPQVDGADPAASRRGCLHARWTEAERAAEAAAAEAREPPRKGRADPPRNCRGASRHMKRASAALAEGVMRSLSCARRGMRSRTNLQRHGRGAIRSRGGWPNSTGSTRHSRPISSARKH